jgi:hypothetical protein
VSGTSRRVRSGSRWARAGDATGTVASFLLKMGCLLTQFRQICTTDTTNLSCETDLEGESVGLLNRMAWKTQDIQVGPSARCGFVPWVIGDAQGPASDGENAFEKRSRLYFLFPCSPETVQSFRAFQLRGMTVRPFATLLTAFGPPAIRGCVEWSVIYLLFWGE